jgi:hypothetical protein
MANKAGRILLIPRGDFDANTEYHMLDFVHYNRNSYVAKKTTTGNLPTNTEYFQPMTDIELNYVTPEMFGAVGDGTTNDAEAFQAALNVCTTLVLSDKNYFLGDSVIDCSDKDSIEIIGNNRKSVITGGTFRINIDDTWMANRNGETNASMFYPSRFEGITFMRHNYHDIPAIICVTPIIVENCRILAKKFVAFPNTTYVDRVNFFECNIQYDSTDTVEFIMGIDGVEQYSDWKGHGDNWVFQNCTFPANGKNAFFHVSDGNHNVTFNNCINPCVCYGSTSWYSDLPQIFFNECHLEVGTAICYPKEGYGNTKALITYSNCFFHHFVKFNDDDMFMGVSYYHGMRNDYLDQNPDVGLTEKELSIFNGVIVPFGKMYKHKKDALTTYAIPTTRDVRVSTSSGERIRTTPIESNMDYVFYYSDNPHTYDATTKILKENVAPNSSGCIRWAIKGGLETNFFLHVFRKNLTDDSIQKCVVYVGFIWLGDVIDVNYVVEDGGNSIDGIYKWVDYDGEFPS